MDDRPEVAPGAPPEPTVQRAATHPLGLVFGTIGRVALGALSQLAAGPVGLLLGAVGGAVLRLVVCTGPGHQWVATQPPLIRPRGTT